MVRNMLLVEDDPQSRAALSHMLLSEGVQLLSCPDAEQALENMPGSMPDVAILDVRLPGMHGDELARRLQVSNPNARIIFVTGETDATDRLQLAVPGCRVMSKPIDPKGLMGMVA